MVPRGARGPDAPGLGGSVAHSRQRFRYLLLVLMDAERAWSYAMQLKQEANTEPRKRFHLLSRLRKAVKHAEELERLCESNRVDAQTKLEAQVSGAAPAPPGLETRDATGKHP